MDATDPCGGVTQHSYDEVYDGAFLTGTTDALGHSVSDTYDFNTGLILTQTDPNNQQTSHQYLDPLNRTTDIAYPDSGHTHFRYATTSVEIDRLMNATTGSSIKATLNVDGLGRETSRVLAEDSGSITTVTQYDPMGRVASMSNPYRGTSNPGQITQYQYDALGRQAHVIEADGVSTLGWTYTGNVTTSNDEAGNSWTRTSDALGRLTKVLEPGGLETDYGYDTLSNLMSAVQVGVAGETVRTRTFSYDGLSRLVTSTNPETCGPGRVPGTSGMAT